MVIKKAVYGSLGVAKWIESMVYTVPLSLILISIQTLIICIIFWSVLKKKNDRQEEVDFSAKTENVFGKGLLWGLAYFFLGMFLSIITVGTYGITGFLVPIIAGLVYIAMRKQTLIKDITENGKKVESSPYVNWYLSLIPVLIIFTILSLLLAFAIPFINYYIIKFAFPFIPVFSQVDTAIDVADIGLEIGTEIGSELLKQAKNLKIKK